MNKRRRTIEIVLSLIVNMQTTLLSAYQIKKHSLNYIPTDKQQ